MEEQDYLVHYGVLGMKWGVRKDKNYKYTSMRTKRLSKKVDKWKKSGSDVASAKTKKYSQKLKVSKQTDKALLKYAKKTSTGKAIAQNLLLGPSGAKSYQTMRATGTSRKKAVATQLIMKSAGIALGAVLGGAAGAASVRYPSLESQIGLYQALKGTRKLDAAGQDALVDATQRIVNKIHKSAVKSAATSGAVGGGVVGGAASEAAIKSSKKKSTKKKTKK